MIKRIITTFTLLAAVIIALPFLPASVDSQAADSSLQTFYVSGTSDYAEAYDVLELLNEMRAELGLSQLTMDSDLLDAAMQRAAECSLYFDHQRPDGDMCWAASSKMSAENIAMGQGSAAAVMNSWTNSSGHYANMTNSSMNSVGIGSFCINGRYVWVQCFGRGTSTNAAQPANSSDTYTVKASTDYVTPAFLSGNGKTLYVGDTHTPVIGVNNEGVLNAPINANSFNWTSSNTAVATVDANGKITAKGEGTAIITAANKSLSTAKVSMTITVNSESKDIIIQYDANGGTGSTPTQVKVLGYPVTISSAAPFRAGYNFIGWSTSSSAASAQYLPGDSYNTDASLYLYAVWQKNPVVSSGSTVRVDLDFSFMDRWYTFTPSKTSSYTFESNSSTDPHILIYDENLTLVADNDDHGSTRDFLLTTNLTAGKKYYIRIYMHSSSTDPFTFTIANSISITYMNNYAAADDDVFTTQGILPGEDAVLGEKHPFRYNYNFLGWSTSANATSATYQPGDSVSFSKDTVLYAVWQNPSSIASATTNTTYTILLHHEYSYKTYKFTPNDDSTYRFESSGSGNPVLYIFDNSGNELLYADDTLSGTKHFRDNFTFTGGKTYYISTMLWEPIDEIYKINIRRVYNIKYSASGADNIPEAQTKLHGDTLTLSSLVPEKEGFTFLGWSATANSATAEYKAGASYTANADITLYAVWQSKSAVITKQPSNATAASGKLASTTITASGDGLEYEWYVCEPGKIIFTKSSITKSSYGYTMTAEKSGRKVYCVVTDKYGNSVKSNTVTFSMLAITKQPANDCAADGKAVAATVTAQGSGLKYTWYVCDAGSTSYTKSSITDSTYTFPMSAAKSGRKVYCVVSDKFGNSVKSKTVTFSLLAITKQPSKACAADGKLVSTTVTAKGDGLKYTWYLCEPGKTAFGKSSITNNTYSYAMTAEKSGRKVYCVVSDKYGNSVKSNTVTLSMLAITKQPANDCAADGNAVAATVTAQGSGLKYTWYVCDAGNTSYTKSSITDNTYTFPMSAAKSGRKVYCVVSDKFGNSVKSKTVTFSLLAITKQPTKASAASGDIVSTTVTAQGSGLKYTWYVCNPGKTTYTKSSITEKTYAYTMTAEKNGRKVYCVVSDKYGNSVKSNTVTLSMTTEVKITKQPTSVFAKSGEIAMVSLTAKGDGLKYQWYVCEPGKTTFTKSSITESTYGFKMTAEKDGRKVYCIVTDKYGNSEKSKTAVLSME